MRRGWANTDPDGRVEAAMLLLALALGVLFVIVSVVPHPWLIALGAVAIAAAGLLVVALAVRAATDPGDTPVRVAGVASVSGDRRQARRARRALRRRPWGE